MKKLTALTSLHMLLPLVIAGCTSAVKVEPAKDLLAEISLQDGIDRPEAENIAKAYFRQNIGCGYFKEITDSDENWVVEGGFGYSGTPIKGFLINKSTGAITSPVGPSYKSPFDISTDSLE